MTEDAPGQRVRSDQRRKPSHRMSDMSRESLALQHPPPPAFETDSNGACIREEAVVDSLAHLLWSLSFELMF